MKVKDLLKEINESIERYSDFLEWDVYTEQLSEEDKEHKRKPSPPKGADLTTLQDVMDAGYGQGWKTIGDSDGWEYFHCVGDFTKFREEKIFTINVNF